ncbi:unnamed protein product [Mytilus coruscus]|uniref:Protein quiver n=1 Tax=Mytilus coruscus TaxID=42192 RepID=A0A6J8B570_MYTCO|nr:unnamed protein product [Mytilus coruscus]
MCTIYLAQYCVKVTGIWGGKITIYTMYNLSGSVLCQSYRNMGRTVSKLQEYGEVRSQSTKCTIYLAQNCVKVTEFLEYGEVKSHSTLCTIYLAQYCVKVTGIWGGILGGVKTLYNLSGIWEGIWGGKITFYTVYNLSGSELCQSYRNMRRYDHNLHSVQSIWLRTVSKLQEYGEVKSQSTLCTIYLTQYCVKVTGIWGGIVGTHRFCSSKDLGDRCQNVIYPDHDRMYRPCVHTCSADGCNSASTYWTKRTIAWIITAVLFSLKMMKF